MDDVIQGNYCRWAVGRGKVYSLTPSASSLLRAASPSGVVGGDAFVRARLVSFPCMPRTWRTRLMEMKSVIICGPA